MSVNQCLNSSQNHFPKFIIDDRGDKTRSTQNLSKLCQNCRLIKDQLQAQIFTLKDKSHQSFMQVIQVQQLHEEEMQLMKVEHQDEITALRQQISRLQVEVNRHQSELLTMQKNSKHHIFNLQQPSFLIDNIEMIECHEDHEKKSHLDDSSFDQFNEIVESKFDNQAEQDFIKNKQNQFLKEANLTNPRAIQKLQKLTHRIMQLEAEVQSLWQTNQQLKKECLKLEANQKSIKNNYESLYKESKFMADHIRTLANDKFKLERKVKELEKQIRDNKIKGMRQSSILYDEKQSQMSIKINGSDIFNHQDLENIRNSFENSAEQKDVQVVSEKSLLSNQNSQIPQIMSKKDVHKPHQTESIIKKSEVFSNNNEIEARRSMPNYKKISHISPSFKKSSVPKHQQNIRQSNPVLKLENQDWKESDKSDFMDQINREIELKTSLKKSMGSQGIFKEKQRISSIPENFRKRSSAQ